MIVSAITRLRNFYSDVIVEYDNLSVKRAIELNQRWSVLRHCQALLVGLYTITYLDCLCETMGNATSLTPTAYSEKLVVICTVLYY